MAVERDKVKAALDAKFKGKSVSKELKDAYAARWADKIENDEAIDAFITDREDDVLDAAKEADRRATAAAQKARQDAADAAAGKKPENDDTTKTDVLPADTPEWAKAIIKQQQDLAAKVQGFEQEKHAQTLQQRFKAHEKIKDIPDALLHGRYPKTEEEFEAAVESASTELAPYVQKLTAAGFDGIKPAPASQGAAAGAGKVDAGLVEFAKKKNEAFINSQKS